MRSKSNTRCASNTAGPTCTVTLLLSASLFLLLLLLPTSVGAFSSPQRRGLFGESVEHYSNHGLASDNVVRGKILPASVSPKSSALFSSPSDNSRNNVAISASRGDTNRATRRRARIVPIMTMSHIRQLLTNLHRRTVRIKRIAAMILLAVALTLGGSTSPALAGRSGGRAGGSFGRSPCSPPMSRPMSPGRGSMGGRSRSYGGGYGGPSMRSSPMLHPGLYRRHPAIYLMPRPGRGLDSAAEAVADAPTTSGGKGSTDGAKGNGGDEGGAASIAPSGAGEESGLPDTIEMNDLVSPNQRATLGNSRRDTRVMSPITYYVTLTGLYGAVMYSANKSRRSDDGTSTAADGRGGNVKSALGPGISVTSLTVSLDVPDRDDPNNILNRIGDTVKRARTGTRKGVQSLIADVALEVLRQEASVKSACSTYAHSTGESEAERTYHRLSTVERSKFERESVHKFGDAKQQGLEIINVDDINTTKDTDKEEHTSRATSAVVTILLQIEGDQTKLPSISSRTDLKNALLRIAADAQVEDCLISAEVLWTPERRGDTMTQQEIASLYPDLVLV